MNIFLFAASCWFLLAVIFVFIGVSEVASQGALIIGNMWIVANALNKELNKGGNQ